MQGLEKTKPGYKKTSSGNIPQEWLLVTIDKLIKSKDDIKTGPFGSSLKKESFVTRGYKVYGQENVIPDDFSIGNYYISEEVFIKMKKYEIRPKDILISLVGTHGKVSLVPKNIERGIINPRLLKITLNESIAIPEFMKILLSSEFIDRQIQKFSHGLTMGILNTQVIKQILFPIPPILEQQKIASIFSKVDELIQKAAQIIEQSQKLKKGLTQKLLTSGIGHANFKNIQTTSGDNVKIPQSWNVVPFSDLCNIRKTGNNINSDLYIGLEHIGQGDNILISKGNVKDFTSSKNRFHKGDILYGKLRPNLNKVYLADQDGHCSTDVLPLVTNQKLLPAFLLRIMTDQRFVWYAVSSSSGTKMPRTNWNAIQNYEAYLPPLEEQHKIVSLFDLLDFSIKKHEEYYIRSRDLKKGLMQKLLRGDIRIKI